MTLLSYESHYQVQSQVAASSTSLTLADDPQASQTFNLAGARTVLVIYQESCNHGSVQGNHGKKAAIDVDGTMYGLVTDSPYDNNFACGNATFWIGTLEAGDHTISGAFAAGGSGETATVNTRSLMILILNGDEFSFVTSALGSLFTSTTLADDPHASATFTPSSACKALYLYAASNDDGNTNETYFGKKIAINNGSDHGETQKSPCDNYHADSILTFFSESLTAIQTTIKGRAAPTAGAVAGINNRHLGVLLFSDDTLLDLAQSSSLNAITTGGFYGDYLGAITPRTTTDNRILLALTAISSRFGSGNNGAYTGLRAGILVNAVDSTGGGVRRTPASSGYSISCSCASITSQPARSGNTVADGFSNNAASDYEIVDQRITIALWLKPPSGRTLQCGSGEFVLTGSDVTLSARKSPLIYFAHDVEHSDNGLTYDGDTLTDDVDCEYAFVIDRSLVALVIYSNNSSQFNVYPDPVTGYSSAISVDGDDVSLVSDSPCGLFDNMISRCTTIWMGKLDAGEHHIKGRIKSNVASSAVNIASRTLTVILFSGTDYEFISDATKCAYESLTAGTYEPDTPALISKKASANSIGLLLYASSNDYGDEDQHDTGRSQRLQYSINDPGNWASPCEVGKAPSFLGRPMSLFSAFAIPSLNQDDEVVARAEMTANQYEEAGLPICVNRRYFAFLVLATEGNETLFDADAGSMQAATGDNSPADDWQAPAIVRTIEQERELLVIAVANRKMFVSGNMPSQYGDYYGISIDAVDVAGQRASTKTLAFCSSESISWAQHLEPGEHTIQGRFCNNLLGETAVIDERVVIALWFLPSSKTLRCGSGSIALTGSDVTLDYHAHHVVMECAPGEFVLTGSDIDMELVDPWAGTQYRVTVPFTVPPKRQDSTYYNVGDIVAPSERTGNLYACTVAGTTGIGEPTWSIDDLQATVEDGEVTWEFASSDNYVLKLNIDNEIGENTPGNIHLNGRCVDLKTDIMITDALGPWFGQWFSFYREGDTGPWYVQLIAHPDYCSGIYIYYGQTDPGYLWDYSGMWLFPFYCDFEYDLGNFDQAGSCWSQDDTVAKYGSYSGKAVPGSDPDNALYKAFINGVFRNVALHGWLYWDGNNGVWFLEGIDNNWNLIGALHINWDGQLQTYLAGTGWVPLPTDVTIEANTWTEFEIAFDVINSKARFLFLKDGNKGSIDLADINGNPISGLNSILAASFLSSLTLSTYWLDNVWIRAYIYPEPAWTTPGAEESKGTPLNNYVLSCDSGTFEIGWPVIPFFDLAAGAVEIDGSDVTLKKDSLIVLESGAFELDWPLIDYFKLGSGALSLVWASIDYFKTSGFAVSLSGQDLTLKRDAAIFLGSGPYSFEGSDISLSKSWLLSPESGAFFLDGSDVNLNRGRLIILGSGSFEIEGEDIHLIKGRIISLRSGEYVLDGQDLILKKDSLIVPGLGEIALDGQDVGLLKTWILSPESGDISLEGSDLGLYHGRTLSLDSGTLEVDGSDVGLKKYSLIVPASGEITLEGQNVGLSKTWILGINSGSLSLSGFDIGLNKGRTLSLDSGSLELLGFDVGLNKGRTLLLDSGIFTLDGSEIGLIFDRICRIGSGSLELDGQLVTLLRGCKISLDSGEIDLTGLDLSLNKGRTMHLGAGSLELDGQLVALLRGRKISLSPGSFSLIGSDVDLNKGRTIILSSGSFDLLGQSVGLLRGSKIKVGSGGYHLTGKVVHLKRGRILHLGAGIYSITGSDINLRTGRKIRAGSSSYIVSGHTVRLLKDSVINAASGEFVLIGSDVGLFIERVWMEVIELDSQITEVIELDSQISNTTDQESQV